ncbi:MAG TPA: amidohydrolase, partial [Syntrophorhabdus aromaticivorans]|nr:amidohydrolase [Syntrophorhabdus aromaticivorans]
MKIFKNGVVVTGDGKTMYENGAVVVVDDTIVGVEQSLDPSLDAYAEEVIDCTGKCVLPGMINHHQHGITFGPMFASGCENYGRDFIMNHLDRSLLQGHTTVLNIDGFVTMDEVKETQRHHPIRIKAATTHAPINLKAADLCDGKGLKEEHRTMT